MPVEIDPLILKGRNALEAEDIDAAGNAVREAEKSLGESDPQVLHLRGLIAWMEGDHERAGGFLLQASDAGPADATIYLDTAEFLYEAGGEADEIEAVLRVMLDMDEIEPELEDQGRVMLAQVRLDDDDPLQALELLDQVETMGETTEGAVYLASVRASVLLALGRNDDAIATLRGGLELAPEDADIHYQLGVTLDVVGDHAGAREMMLRVLELDLESDENPEEGLGDGEADELRALFDEVLEDMPGQLLDRVANVPVRVEVRPTEQDVRNGADPRCAIYLLGTAADADGKGAKLDQIVMFRDQLTASIEDDEDIPEQLVMHLLGDMRRFFRLDELAYAVG